MTLFYWGNNVKKIFIICAALLSLGLIGCDGSNGNNYKELKILPHKAEVYWGEKNDLLVSFKTTSQIKCTLHNLNTGTNLESSVANTCFFDHSDLISELYVGANDITISNPNTDKELMTVSIFIPEGLDFNDVLVWKKVGDEYMITIPYQPSSEDKKNNQTAYGYAMYTTSFETPLSGQDAIAFCESNNGWKLPLIGDKYDPVAQRREASYNTLYANSAFMAELYEANDTTWSVDYFMSSSLPIIEVNNRDSFDTFKKGDDYYGNHGIFDVPNRGGPGAYGGITSPFLCVLEGVTKLQ